ncbi:CDP-diacylglycerol--glycerol-3-phosphate 3-phosphatidyltransferase [Haladaptatus litoreus]|uniref:CDP-diacylglycerol--glycerol-3-phosphate 3-phosphatidyltransferase n=1 Tax=Haladaptatus litoreus TaxID=553468 RepID=A0A1N7CIW6_9EURY|nr:CDP-alcohol phosphatidyltransferase family protein [Haladaptatus litoreus]SIR63417.1 CDP-diacylglycerol--glycerol-3-phosphate 3-phosphatidyltransferase [Haladaptatus litoreus]
MSGETRTLTTRLRIEWSLAIFIAFSVALTGSYFVDAAVVEDVRWQWFFLTGGVLVYEFWFLQRHLSLNDQGDGSLGAANVITLTRGMLYAVVGGFLIVSPVEGVRWIPGLCYGTGAILDFLDGWVARQTNQQSTLGAKLDLSFDLLGALVASLVAVVWGRLPIWYLAISAAGYLFRGGTAYRRYRGVYVAPLPPSRVRRPLAALHMIVITIALIPVLSSDVIVPLATVAMIPSLLVFVRDWLVVSGRITSVNLESGFQTSEEEDSTKREG